MAKITYLFGAGASAQAIPIVKNFPNGIKSVYERLAKEEYQLSDENFNPHLVPRWNNSKELGRQKLIEDLKWLESMARDHASVDTFAKKLFIRGSLDELVKLKATLSVYFTVVQASPKYDKRYDTFFASTLNRMYEFPNNIKIISWNYDLQFEKALHDLYDRKLDIGSYQTYLNAIWKYSMEHPNSDKFCLLKLNGIAAISGRQPWHEFFINNINENISKEDIELIVTKYLQIVHSKLQNYSCMLSFAWETENLISADSNIVNKTISSTKDTEILIIIGYSFPFFNREVDRKIIGSMNNLNKVYFQDKSPDNIKLRFQAIRKDVTGIEFVLYNDVEQFLLPFEL